MIAGFRHIVAAAMVLLVSAVFPAAASAQRVALVAAEFSSRALDVQAQLSRAGLTDVTFIDVSTGPAPTLTDLLQYDAVFTWSDLPYSDPGPLGNALADYVDQGGGVVQAVFSYSTNIGGRWSTDGYAPFTSAPFQQQSGMTLVPSLAHPILTGVASLDGGVFGFHHVDVTTQGCGTVVARWSNGQPLVGVRRGPNGGRIVGLNMFPPSSNSHPSFWNAATDGHVLMANSLRYVAESEAPRPISDGPAIALVAADETTDLEGVECQLQDLNLFSSVDIVDARSTTPTTASLLQYDAVLTWADVPYGNAIGVGDTLADYVDQGGAVVQAAYGGGALAGRWRDGGYQPFSEAPVTPAGGLSLVQNVPGHVLFAGVPGFTAPTGSYHHSPVALDSATSVIASWSDGEPMIGVGANPTRRIVGFNLAPAFGDGRLSANTLLFAANHWPTADAGADATVEATSSSGVSFTLNATATDVDGDSLSYTWSGAISASTPSITIDVPPPTAPGKTQAHTVTLTVSDGKGGEATDSVTLTVTDTAAPVLSGMPTDIVTVDATSSAGAEVTYGPVTAIDAVDGATPVVCAPSGMFPIGDTLVTCSSSDSRDNTTSGSFTVRVTDLSVPGHMQGKGFLRSSGKRHDFMFEVSETAAGVEAVTFSLKVRGEGELTATSVNFVVFAGKTVLFRGTGSWNEIPGVAYEVYAVDGGRTGRKDDYLRITASAPSGAVITVEGMVNGTAIRSPRH